MSFGQLEAIMRGEYDSSVRQIQVHSEQETLDFLRFMASKDITEESVGLKRLVDRITTYPRSVPKTSDPNHRRFDISGTPFSI